MEHLTADEKEWIVLRVSANEDLGDLVQKVDQANPDIVILSEDELGHDQQLLARLNQDCPALKKVIRVSLSENLLEVYSKQKIQVNSVGDLFSEVENQLSKLCPHANQNEYMNKSSIVQEVQKIQQPLVSNQ